MINDLVLQMSEYYGTSSLSDLTGVTDGYALEPIIAVSLILVADIGLAVLIGYYGPKLHQYSKDKNKEIDLIIN